KPDRAIRKRDLKPFTAANNAVNTPALLRLARTPPIRCIENDPVAGLQPIPGPDHHPVEFDRHHRSDPNSTMPRSTTSHASLMIRPRKKPRPQPARINLLQVTPFFRTHRQPIHSRPIEFRS